VTSVADSDPGSGPFYSLDLISGMNFSRIPNPVEMFFGEIFFKNPCSLIFLLIKLVPETIRSKKKVGFIFHPPFMYSRIRDPVLFYPQDPGSGSGMKNLGIRIRDKTSRIRNTGRRDIRVYTPANIEPPKEINSFA
jgi:hypothetical protein